jgi:hypothetical protein
VPTADRLRAVMQAAGVSTVLDDEPAQNPESPRE